MNKVIAILVAFFSIFCAYAQKADKSEQYRVRITKVDGTTLEGYSMTSFYNTMLPEVKKFTFSTEYKGETTTYTSEEVKRVEFVNLEMDSMPLVYESVQALSTIPGPLRKNPKPFKKPVFLRLFLRKKNSLFEYQSRNSTSSLRENTKATFKNLTNGSIVGNYHFNRKPKLIFNKKSFYSFHSTC